MRDKAPKHGNALTIRRLIEILECRGDNIQEVMDYPLYIGVNDVYGNYAHSPLTEAYPATIAKYEEFKGKLTFSVYLKEQSLRALPNKRA